MLWGQTLWAPPSVPLPSSVIDFKCSILHWFCENETPVALHLKPLLCFFERKSFHMLQEMLPKQVLMHTCAVSGIGPGMQQFFWLLIFFFFCDIPFFILLSDFFLFPSFPSLSNQPHRTGKQKHSPLDNLHVSWWNNSTYLGASQIRSMIFPRRATNNTHLPKTAFSQYTKEG